MNTELMVHLYDMTQFNKNDNISIVVGKNVKSLRIQAGLTIEGVSFAFSISISYAMMIEKGTANISAKLAKSIADFFQVEVAQLYTDRTITLKTPLKIPDVRGFYKEYDNNPKFFLQRRSEYSAANFVKTILLKDEFMKDPRSVTEIKEHSLITFGRELHSQELSRELRRLFIKGIIERDDKFGNGAVYYYKIKTN